MDITINPASGTTGQHYTPPALKVPTDSVPASAPQVISPVQPKVIEAAVDTAPAAPDPAAQYETSLRQAALSFKNVYAVSDQDFTIFKDTTGKYITRYVSLRDGKVTYVPEPTLVKQMQQSGGNPPSHFAISV